MRFKPEAILLIGALTGMALAGCVGGDDAPSPEEDENPDTTGKALVSEDTGAIRGGVSSDLFEPLDGALVEVLDRDRERTEWSAPVTRGGEFAISYVDPGEYILYVTAIGYHAGQRGLRVEAQEVTDVQVQLEPLPTDGPFVEIWEERGIVSTSVAWQVEPPGVGCIMVPMTDGVGSSCGNIRFGADGNFNMEIGDEVETILVEMVWTPAGPLGENLRLELICPEVPRGSVGGAVADKEHPCYFDSTNNVSPVVHRIDAGHWGEHGYNHTGLWDGRVFAAYGTIGTYDLIGIDAGVAYEQSFEIFISLFHREPAPEGFSRMPDA